jgi:AcrR family transcriptional regulator
MDTASVLQPGRKRDHSRDLAILDAVLDVLAEQGYNGMSMDAVASRAKAGKATVYRRWPSKAHLVHDAIVRMAQQDVDLESLPDTGSLRGDIVALTRPDTFGERRLKVIAGLTSMLASDRTGLGAAAYTASVAVWVAANRVALERAVDRGEIAASADLALLSRLIPSMCMYRVAVERIALDPDFTYGLIDRVLLPAVDLDPG